MRQSDTPLNLSSVIKGAAVSAGAAIGKSAAGNSFGQFAGGIAPNGLASLLRNTSEGENRGLSANCFEQFKNLVQQKAIISVQTGLRTFENMVITSLSVNRNSSTGRSIEFTVKMREIRIVSSQEVVISQALELGVNDQAQKTTDQGRQDTSEVPPKRKSVLKAVFSGLFG
jgi:hypothetical protein